MPETPTSYAVSGSTTRERLSTITAGNQVIPIEAAWAAEHPSGLPGPAELLAAALVGCLLKGLERASAMMPFSYDSAEVHVTAHRQDVPPKFTDLVYEIRLVTDEPPRRIDLLHRNLRQFGTITNTLAAACNVRGTIAVAAVSGTVEA